MEAISTFFKNGGVWMYPILVMSIIGLGVMIERFMFLYFRHNINAQAFMHQIQKLVMGNNIDRAIKLCNSAQNAALAKVIKSGLTRANRGPDEIQNSLEEAALEVSPAITKRTTVLQQIANIATLLGLLGTILGLIAAFSALADITDPEQQSKMLVKGISVAMNTTAFGLMVAIPCLLAQVALSAITKKILDDIEQYSVKLENLLISRLHGGAGDNRG